MNAHATPLHTMAVPKRGRRQSARPRSQRSIARERMVEAALEQFAAQGYDRASLSDIAKPLGVTAPLLLYHFDSKEKLWMQSIDLLFKRLDTVLEAAIDDGRSRDPHAAAELLVRRLVYFFAAEPSFCRVLAHESTTPSARLDWLADRHLTHVFGQIEEVLERAVATGSLKPAPPAQTLLMILGAASKFLESQALIEAVYGQKALERDGIDDYTERVVDLCFHGLVAEGSFGDRASALRAASA